MIKASTFSPIKIFEEVTKVVDSHNLDAGVLFDGCYAFRFPLFHFIRVFHPDTQYPLWNRIGDFTFLASDLVGGLLWFEKLGVIKVFSVFMIPPLNTLTSGLRGLSYLFYGVHAMKQLKGNDKVQAVLDLSASVAQVALAVLIVAGVTHAVVIPAITIVAYGMTTASIAYHIYHIIRDLYRIRVEKKALQSRNKA